MKKLTRMEMKNVKGGMMAPPAGGCIYVGSSNGQQSCWYSSSGNAEDLCNRVYGSNCQWVIPNVDCTGCTMN